MFTVTPRLVQQFRYDLGWQSISGLTNTNYGSGKGLELVPVDRVELSVSAPPYLTRTKPGVLQNNFVEYADEHVVQYTTSTEPGSSGSPVISDEFEVVAIHHARR